jgi:hypothetical protein
VDVRERNLEERVEGDKGAVCIEERKRAGKSEYTK